jgi:hypothetical protein
MNIQALYDALDVLEEDARSVAEDFASTGDLKVLSTRLNDLGGRAYAVSYAVDAVIKAFQFEG